MNFVNHIEIETKSILSQNGEGAPLRDRLLRFTNREIYAKTNNNCGFQRAQPFGEGWGRAPEKVKAVALVALERI